MSWDLVTYRHRGGVLVQYVLPRNDAIAHTESADCWCRPTWIEEDALWVHHSADGREAHEPDARYPPAVRH